jgi:orotate phosphoribosyltransferase
MSTQAEIVAKDLLDIQAITLSPDKPFTWASGLHSPIYTDNRLTISYPAVRRNIYEGMVQLINEHFQDVDVIAWDRYGRDSPRGLGCRRNGPANDLRAFQA